MSVTRYAQSTRNKFAYFCNISKKAWGMKLNFCLQITKDFLQDDSITFSVRLSRHAQSTENNQFTIFLQYLKEIVKDEVDFLPGDKCRRFFYSDTVILGAFVQACSNYLK